MSDVKPEIAKRVVTAVMHDLEDRSGFDGWWDSLDEDIQLEVLNTLADKTEKVLQEYL